MKCKKVYDIIGHYTNSHKDCIVVNGAMLMPYVLKDGKLNRVSVKICNETDVGINGINARLLTIKIDGNSSSLRNEEVKDLFHFKLEIPKKELDFKKGKKIRLIVFHDDKMCEEPDPGLIECVRDYVSHAGYLESWEFDSRKCGEWIVFHGPKKSGESVMVGM